MDSTALNDDRYGFGFYFVATRNIEKDEEILAEYVQSLDQTTTEPVLTLTGVRSVGHIPSCFRNTSELNQHLKFMENEVSSYCCLFLV